MILLTWHNTYKWLEGSCCHLHCLEYEPSNTQHVYSFLSHVCMLNRILNHDLDTQHQSFHLLLHKLYSQNQLEQIHSVTRWTLCLVHDNTILPPSYFCPRLCNCTVVVIWIGDQMTLCLISVQLLTDHIPDSSWTGVMPLIESNSSKITFAACLWRQLWEDCSYES